MHATDTVLIRALAQAPRRYLVRPLPVDEAAAAATDAETALAYAIEAARAARAPASDALLQLFTGALAALVRQALSPQEGDASFQALVLRTDDAQVDEYVRLSAKIAADRRAVRTAIDAFAHPGKLRLLAHGPERDAFARLHALAAASDWPALAQQLAALAGGAAGDFTAPILAGEPMQRLLRRDALQATAGVQRYQVLCAQRGPLAGSDDAAAQGRVSARLGEAAEHGTLHAFRTIAQLLTAACGGHHRFRAVQGLRTPPGFPGETGKAKNEWDAAILRLAPASAAADVVLLAEVKAAPAAATPDFSRLHRGLERLAQAHAHAAYTFACDQGELRLAGESLRRLQPQGRALPPHVIYCCAAPPEIDQRVLSAASKAVLLAEPASVEFARRLLRAETPSPAHLAPVWHALATEPRLRSALWQFHTMQAVRQAMLHPDDLIDAVRNELSGVG